MERQNLVLSGERRENSAEHSWHVAMMALILEPELEEWEEAQKIIGASVDKKLYAKG